MKLSEDRLSSLNEYGDRNFIIPGEVKGFFKKRKSIVHFILMLIFLTLPWLEINGHQAILLNIPKRQFALFGMIFWAHDGPLIFFVLAILTFSLAFVTSVWGRVWCGWACPQTVFIESVFRRIEIWIEGNYIARRKLASSPMSFEKFRKTTFKWLAYIFISLIISHSFLAYFVGTERLQQIMHQPPLENWSLFVMMLFLTTLIAFDFGWFREQFCIIMCPYGRFQSVLMDSTSMAVLYDDKRTDCIQCNRCVQVCPTGIDIRKGLQLECIACTACIDACDEIMDKVQQPRKLIRYSNLRNTPITLKKYRSLAYLFLIILCVAGLSYSISQKSDFHLEVLRGKDTPYQVIQNADQSESVINHFKLHVKNLKFKNENLEFVLSSENSVKWITPFQKLELTPGNDQYIHFFAQFSSTLLNNGTYRTQIQFKDGQGKLYTKEVTLVGP